jgi:hypothetical protein
MPKGSRLRLRYELKWIHENVRNELERNAIKGREVCVVYVDIEQGKPIDQFLPVRSGKVVSSEVDGAFCSIEVQLEGFAFAEDVGALNSQLRILRPSLPKWSSTTASVEGHFCLDVQEKVPALSQNLDPSKWQEMCKRLNEFSAYKDEPMFYRLDSVRETATGIVAKFKDGALQLESGRSYDFRVLHFSPKLLKLEANPKNKDLNWLTIDGDEKAMTFVSAKALAIDSDYDIKVVRVRTSVATLQRIDGRVFASRRFSGCDKPEEATWDFDLHARIVPDWWKMMRDGLLIGIPVAAQGLVLTFNNVNITNTWAVAFWVTVAGLFTGFAASFGLRKA